MSIPDHNTEIVNVSLVERSYPIYIGLNLLNRVALIKPHIKSKQILIVTNTVVAPLYLDQLKSQLGEFKVDTIIIPDGEKFKTIDTYTTIINHLAEHKHHRSTTIIALGGGVIGDMAGFAAATYQRGVSFIQIPTTLLAQVDSSVGGKTAINLPQGKNLLGAFYQPQCVLIDTCTLKTLPDREYRAGLAEVIKYGFIQDHQFVRLFTESISKLLRQDQHQLIQIVKYCCQAKADIVRQDETEQGIRALLNFGHTFAHAIEKITNFDLWLHGEAVAAGMLMAADLSQRLNYINADTRSGIDEIISRLEIPILAQTMSFSVSDFIDAIKLDKKASSDSINFILLQGIGQGFIKPIAIKDLESIKPTLIQFIEQKNSNL